jgi:prepilin-type N-terminal cleavage/methylation domain-containing protein
MMTQKGFTLLEILLVITAIGVLAGIVIVAINPVRQLAQVRDVARKSEINALWKALNQYEVDNQTLPTEVMNMTAGTEQEICDGDTSEVDCTNEGLVYLNDVLVPIYLSSIPKDPNATGNGTGYFIYKSPTNQTGISSNHGELQEVKIGRTFQPTDFPDLAFWFDATDSLELDGSNRVSTWSDLSGNGNDAVQSAATSRPELIPNILNGSSALLFDGTDDYFSITNLFYNSRSIAGMTISSTFQTLSNQQQMVVSYDRNEFWRLSIRDDGGNETQIAFDTISSTGGQDDMSPAQEIDADGNTRLLTGWFSRQETPSKTIRLDGQEIQTRTPHGTNFVGRNTTRYGTIGTGSEADSEEGTTGPDLYLHGYLGEVIYYERGLNANELTVLENYLMRKWGVE